MFDSIFKDIKYYLKFGDIITRLIIINVIIFFITAFTNAFAPTFYRQVLPYLAVPSDISVLLYRPWTLITHGFIHDGLWHVIFNMLTLYWFGNIGGDLLGFKRILPVYLSGILFGALFFIASGYFNPSVGGYAVGASAGVMAIVFMAVMASPDYEISLILLGRVKIKYIGIVVLFLDLIGVAGQSNSGGHAAHIGGAIIGMLYVFGLRKGFDIFSSKPSSPKTKKSAKRTLKVVHKKQPFSDKNSDSDSLQDQVDQILDKIKKDGYNSLSDVEKDILYKASNTEN